MSIKFDNAIDNVMDKFKRYSPETADRMTNNFMSEGESYLAEATKDGTKLDIKCYDFGYNRFYNIKNDLSIKLSFLDSNDNLEDAYICFSKGLLEILVTISIDMSNNGCEAKDMLTDLNNYIDILSRHLEVSVSMLAITPEYISDFKKHLMDQLQQLDVDIDDYLVVLGWANQKSSLLYIYDGSIVPPKN